MSDTTVVFIGGLSGSGKSTAMAALEDRSFYCVDNLPPQLIHQFLGLCTKATPPIRKIALAIDSREARFLRRLPQVVTELRQEGTEVDLYFLECSDEALVNRYRETRRVHPHSPSGSVEEGIAIERRLLVDVARIADTRIDTSDLNVHELKETVGKLVSAESRATVVRLVSFGFRYGPPAAAETLFDVRFLPNPYFEPALRPGSGLEPPVAAYVLQNPQGEAFLERLADLIGFLLPLYDREGKAYLTIGVGCTGGRHRSVAVAEAVAAALGAQEREVNVEHRDVDREPEQRSGADEPSRDSKGGTG